MLARYGVAFIWDTHVAAAAAYGRGKLSIADDLTEIGKAAEEIWLATSGTCLLSPTVTHQGSTDG